MTEPSTESLEPFAEVWTAVASDAAPKWDDLELSSKIIFAGGFSMLVMPKISLIMEKIEQNEREVRAKRN